MSSRRTRITALPAKGIPPAHWFPHCSATAAAIVVGNLGLWSERRPAAPGLRMDVTTRTDTTTEFLLPPVVRNARGQVRRAGFELEYSGMSLNLSATLVRTVFGGEHVAKTTFVHRV